MTTKTCQNFVNFISNKILARERNVAFNFEGKKEKKKK
jgi:hypothetical protein